MTGFGADARGGVKGSAPIRRTAKVGHTTPHLQLTLEPCSRAMPGGCRRGGGLAQAQEGAKVVGELGVGEFTCGVLELYSAEGAATPITKCIRVSIGGVDGKYSIWEGLCVGGKRHANSSGQTKPSANFRGLFAVWTTAGPLTPVWGRWEWLCGALDPLTDCVRPGRRDPITRKQTDAWG